MVKIIVEYKVKESKDIQPALAKLRSSSLTYPGFVSAEILRSVKDVSIMAVIQTWQKPEDWWGWETSKVRQDILQEIQALLVEEPKAAVYNIVPTGWT